MAIDYRVTNQVVERVESYWEVGGVLWLPSSRRVCVVCVCVSECCVTALHSTASFSG